MFHIFVFSGTSQPHLSVLCYKDYVLTGTFDGSIYLWEGTKLCSVVKAHSGSTAALCLVDGGESVIAGGKGGSIKKYTLGGKDKLVCEKIWEKDKEKDKETFLKSASQISSLCYGYVGSDPHKSKSFIVGTTKSEIIKFTADKEEKTYINAHNDGELWGLSVHPLFPHLFATGGDEKTVRIYDAKIKENICLIKVSNKTRVVEWGGSKGEVLCVGMQVSFFL